jgi:hypothetical protein
LAASRPDLVRTRLSRVPLLVLGIASLGIGVWGGLLRLPLGLPAPAVGSTWALLHGPIMVCCFLGTVIGLERAVGLQMWWPYGAPIFTGVGALGTITGLGGTAPAALLTLGSLWFSVVSWRVVAIRIEAFTVIMAVGSVTWVVGNALWLGGRPIPHVVPWWIAFLALTIVGERLDLGRFHKRPDWAQPLLVGLLAVLLAGATWSVIAIGGGQRLLGAGLLLVAVWLALWDIARRTVRAEGLPRFMALCLLAGYFWMALAGALLLGLAPLQAGMAYDAALHAFFLGFVFSMIFGHAPVIFPAVLVMRPIFTPAFYAHATVLHLALALRVVGDLTGAMTLRQWGGAAGGVAIVIFLANTVRAVVGELRGAK